MIILNQNKFFINNFWLLVVLTGIFHGCVKTASSDSTYEGDWARSSDFEGVARTEAVSFIIGNYAYVGTGYKDNDTRLSDFWQFNPATGTWKQKANLPGAARNSATAFAINDKGYVGTGYDGANKLNDFYEYDPATNIWTKKADFAGSARYDAIGFSIGNKGYLATGFDDNYLKDNWQYDPSTDVWIQKSSLGGYKRKAAVAFVIDDKGYVCTGEDNGDYVNDLWVYDGSTDTWTEKRKISNANSDESYDDDYAIVRDNAIAFVMDGKGYITCGENGGVINTTWEYAPSSDVWTKKTGFEGTARVGAVGFTINNIGYIATGNSSSYQFDDCWLFKPDTDQTDDDN